MLGGKRDVVPGRLNRLTFTAETPGEYRGQCAEFCGVSHANMGMRVIVDAPDAFARWVAGAEGGARPSRPPARPRTARRSSPQSACVGCHTIRGVSSGALGPDLTTFGSRHTLAAGILPNTVDNVAAWLKNPPALKPDAKMPALGLTGRAGARRGDLPDRSQVMSAHPSGRVLHAPAAAVPGVTATTSTVLELADDRRPQADRHPLRRDRLRLLPARRGRGAS